MPVLLAAERYGLTADRAGMVCCPFHDDHTPSLKLNEDYFYCFGCGAGGDVVSLTARLFDLRPYEAAGKLAADFGVDIPATVPPDGSLNRFQSDLRRCQETLNEFLDLLVLWKNRYRPKHEDDTPDKRYIEACQKLEHIDYIASILATGTLEQRARTMERLLADGTLSQQARLKKLSEEERSSEFERG